MSEFDTQESADLAVAFDDMIGSLGGVDLSRTAESDPASRTAIAASLDDFGLWDIDALAGAEEAHFATVLCQRAGRHNLPYPVAERLSAASLEDVDALCIVDPRTPIIPHAGLGLRWAGVDGDAVRTLAEVTGVGTPARIAPFTSAATIGPAIDADATEREALGLLLTGSTLLGVCDAAAEETYAYVGTRRQFGSPIGSFQGVRFALTDVATALQGAHELGRYALWSFTQRRGAARADALAFRIAALEAADITFNRCHQAHGAIGLCDETDLSWLSRHSRTLRHAPWGITRTEQRLLEVSLTEAIVGPFSA
jgi:hypothetical protein